VSKIEYVPHRFSPDSLAIVELAETICDEYARQGLDLTLRQLYYQFIRRDYFPNSERSYKRLGSIVNDARLAGMIDWDHVQDRGREAHGVGWLNRRTPVFADQLAGMGRYFSLDVWKGQTYRPEVWIEKQALEQVVQRATGGLRVPYFACKGYVSQSEMWGAGQRIGRYVSQGYEPVIIHLGDHDPSGIDMTRDIADRLALFVDRPVQVQRIALNMAQVELYGPPPNPAKLTDSRAEGYIERYGSSSWELDALNPEQLTKLIRDTIEGLIDPGAWEVQRAAEQAGSDEFDRLGDELGDRWDDIQQYLADNPKGE
jgi:hypothetical protein